MSWIAVGVIGGMAVGGIISNTTGKSKTSTYGSTEKSGITLADPSQIEKDAGSDISGQYSSLKDLLGRGPGAEAVDASNREQLSFVDMMRQISASGGLPTDEDRRQANIFADDLFKPQQEALNQSFIQQNEQAARLAAQLNRPINDPIIQSKLRQEQMRQSAMLSADRSAFVAQESRNSPFRRLELQGQLADAQGALASQAMANRMQLLNLGNAIQSQERNWRLQTGERYGIKSGDVQQQQEAGFAGGFNGAIAGAGAGASLMGGFSGLAGMFGGRGGGGSTSTGNTPAYTPGGNGDYSTFAGARDPFPATVSPYAPRASRVMTPFNGSNWGGTSRFGFTRPGG